MSLPAQFFEHQLPLKHLKKKKKIVQYEPVIESVVTGKCEICEYHETIYSGMGADNWIILKLDNIKKILRNKT
jgi:hypothetical protein